MVLNANQNQEGKLIEGTDSEMIAAKSQDFSSQNGHSDMSLCCYYTQLLGLFFSSAFTANSLLPAPVCRDQLMD